MSKPLRPKFSGEAIEKPRMFFVTTRTKGGRFLLQTERMANMFIDVLRSYVRAGEFVIHDFVVMPNHVHVMMTVPPGVTIERAVQLIKGNFSFRAGKELGFRGAIWQRGFSEEQITSEQSFKEHRSYIDNNPVKARLVDSSGQFLYGSAYLKMQKRRGATSAQESSTRAKESSLRG